MPCPLQQSPGRAPHPLPGPEPAPSTSHINLIVHTDIRMYEQLEKTRDMLSDRLSESQRTASVQEEAIIARDKDLEK